MIFVIDNALKAAAHAAGIAEKAYEDWRRGAPERELLEIRRAVLSGDVGVLSCWVQRLRDLSGGDHGGQCGLPDQGRRPVAG